MFSPFTKQKCIQIFQLFIDCGFIVHTVEKRKPFADDYLFFRFTEESLDKEFIYKVVENFKDLKRVINLTSSLDKLNEFYFAISDTKLGVSIQDRSYRFRTYPSCFIGSEAIDWICSFYSLKRPSALFFGELMRTLKAFDHVTNGHLLEDDYYFYEMKPYADFSFACIKYVSQITPLNITDPNKPIEITKDELLRHLTKSDINTLINKARIYMDESLLSKKPIDELNINDLKEVFKKMNIIQIMKTLSDDSQQRMTLTIQTINRLSQFKKKELQKELILLFNQLEEKEEKQKYLECIYKIREIKMETILAREELALHLQTKDEIIDSSNHWMNVCQGIPNEILKFYTKSHQKGDLIAGSFEKTEVDLKKLKEIMTTLPKRLIIQHLIRIKREGMIQIEKDRIRNIFNSSRMLISGLLSPDYKNRKMVMLKILENPKLKDFIEKEGKRKSLSEENTINFLLQEHILSLMGLLLMRSQDLLELANVNYFMEFFGKKELNNEWKIVYNFFKDYHELSEIKNPFSKSNLIEKFSESEKLSIVQMIQDQEYKNLSIFFELPEKEKLTTSQVNEIINYIPREEMEIFSKILTSKQYLNSPEKENLIRTSPKKDLLKMISNDSSLKMSLKNENYIKLIDLYFENNEKYIPNEFIIVKELFQLIQKEYKKSQVEYQLYDVKRASFIDENIKKKKKIMLRYKGMILGIIDQYEYENSELFFKFDQINKEELFFKRETTLSSKGYIEIYDLKIMGIVYEKAVIVYSDPKTEFFKLKGFAKFSSLKIKKIL